MSDYYIPEEIPEEIQFEILMRLPVRSLLRFRCACRSWNHVIDSFSFHERHLALQHRQFILQFGAPDFLILDPRTIPNSSSTLRGLIPTERFHLIGTHSSIVSLYNPTYRWIHLWNPWIRRSAIIDLPSSYDFDPPGAYSALWIDPSIKEFKIVVFELRSSVDDFRTVEIYSSIDRKWKKMPLDVLEICNPLQGCPAIVIQEVAYWRCYRQKDEELGMAILVLSFDFDEERFEFIEAPMDPYEEWNHPMLCTWQGSVALVYVHSWNPDRRCEIYAKQEGDFWVHVLGFDIPSNILSVVWVLEEIEQGYNRIIATTGHGDLVFCDTSDGICIPLIDQLPYNVDVFMAFGLVQSLVESPLFLHEFFPDSSLWVYDDIDDLD